MSDTELEEPSWLREADEELRPGDKKTRASSVAASRARIDPAAAKPNDDEDVRCWMNGSTTLAKVRGTLLYLTFYPFWKRLSGVFGWQYCASCVLAYGINQGVGEKLVFGGKQYYMLDSLGLSSATYGRVDGFAHIPWELKSLFGLLSDTVPIGGFHRAPYMLIAGALGTFALTLLAILPPDAIGATMASVLFLLANMNFAMPDVIIDATVAERSKQRPEFGASLQALCWGSLGLCGMPSGIVSGYLLDAFGPRLLFGLAISAALAVCVPPLGGWLGEKRRSGRSCSADQYRALCSDVWSHPTKRIVASSAALVACYSIFLGTMQLTLGQEQPEVADTITLIGNPCLAWLLFLLLRRVDPCLAKAAAFTFLSGALQPSSSVLFEWAHAPAHGSSDQRCFSTAQCDVLVAAGNATASAHDNTTALTASNSSVAELLPCGWAAAQGLPCISPIIYTWVSVVGSAALVGGTTLYTTWFQSWPYRKIIACSQVRVFPC